MSLYGEAALCTLNGTLGQNQTANNNTCKQQRMQNAPIVSMPEEARIFLICLYATIFILGLTGNALVCYVIGKNETLLNSQ